MTAGNEIEISNLCYRIIPIRSASEYEYQTMVAYLTTTDYQTYKIY